ncbi:MAG TPA: hypothetical protein VK175_06275 [Leadbetterella sp.]|nr:hypothetical protein [Leadbetterella sp.]
MFGLEDELRNEIDILKAENERLKAWINKKPSLDFEIKIGVQLIGLINVADQIANARVRLSLPHQNNQTKEDIINESKNLESLEYQLRVIANELNEKLKSLEG